jgi:hypothetical protein
MHVLFGLFYLGLAIMAFKAVWTTLKAVVTGGWNLVTVVAEHWRRPMRCKEAPILRMPTPDRDWQRLSREVQDAIHARCPRDPGARRLAQLEIEIEIERFEIELARLTAEKAAIKKRTRRAPFEDGQMDLFTADRSTAQAQLEAMRGVLGCGTGRMRDPRSGSFPDPTARVLAHGSVRPTAPPDRSRTCGFLTARARPWNRRVRDGAPRSGSCGVIIRTCSTSCMRRISPVNSVTLTSRWALPMGSCTRWTPTSHGNWSTRPSRAKRRRRPAPFAVRMGFGCTGRSGTVSCGLTSCRAPTITRNRGFCFWTA